MQKKKMGALTSSLKRFKQVDPIAPPLGVYDPNFILTRKRVKNCVIKPTKRRLKSMLHELGIEAMSNDLDEIRSKFSAMVQEEESRSYKTANTFQKFKNSNQARYENLIPYTRKMNSTMAVISNLSKF